MREMPVVLDGDAAEPAAGEAAEAPEAVRGRHDRARRAASPRSPHWRSSRRPCRRSCRRTRTWRRPPTGTLGASATSSRPKRAGSAERAQTTAASRGARSDGRHHAMALTAPAPNSRISRPSVNSLMSSRVRNTGICGAQLPVRKPLTKNIAATAQRPRMAIAAALVASMRAIPCRVGGGANLNRFSGPSQPRQDCGKACGPRQPAFARRSRRGGEAAATRTPPADPWRRSGRRP